MAFLLPEAGEAGIAAIEGGEAETIPKMAEKSASKSSSLQDLFLYKSMQQPQAQPFIINNTQNKTPLILNTSQQPPQPQQPQENNNIVSIENNKIIKIEEKQINNESLQLEKLEKQPQTKTTMQQLQALIDIYNQNLTFFHNQMDARERFY